MGGGGRGEETFISINFVQLFRSQGSHDAEWLLSKVDVKVTEAMNDIVSMVYTVEEVKSALDDIGELKVPGPDGMPTIFFKKFWEIIGEKVQNKVLQVLRGGLMLP